MFYRKRREDFGGKRIENLNERIIVMCVFPRESKLLMTFSLLQVAI